MERHRQPMMVISCWLLLAATAAFCGEDVRDPVTVDYLRDIKPIFAKHCYACHGPLKQSGGLRLDTGEAVRKGGEAGEAIVIGKDVDSKLIAAVTGTAGFRMPPENEGAPLSDVEVALLRTWIQQGATSPADETPAEDPRGFWSYQPVRRPPLPPVSRHDWPLGPLDAWIAAEHDKHQLTPRSAADKAVWLRRVHLDLLGVPPTRDDLNEFLANDAPDAFERAVERLLASPFHGQRWGRHWMDVWRYSDWYGSRGINEIRYSQRHIWRWRDWIVEAVNADKGYDQMIVEMLAGDEAMPGDLEVARATGFLGRNWYKFDRNVWMFETVEQTSQAFLGLTLKCCRCHDHKFDPITQRDYYRFRAFFEPHDVRTDPRTANLQTEKDATLGPVLKDGVSFVYDKQADAPTYLFARGDNRYPKTDEPLTPAVPPTLGNPITAIQPVSLPLAVVAPTLRPEIVDGLLGMAQKDVNATEAAHRQAVASVMTARQNLADFLAGKTEAVPAGTLFTDRFEQPRPDVWKPLGGQWEYEERHVTQKTPGHFVTMVANVNLPIDFVGRLRYRTLEPGSIHSVGIFFDVTSLTDCQAIYTATNNQTASVQAFHRQGGNEHYPSSGIFPSQIKLNELVTLDIAARGQQLNVWVNGELAIVYTMPTPRRAGTFALWTHAGTAEFHELQFDPLPTDFPMAAALSERTRAPYQPRDQASFERALSVAEATVPLAEKRIGVARQEFVALEARIAAERAKLGSATDAEPLAKLAAQRERQVAVGKAEVDLLEKERGVKSIQQGSFANDEARKKATTDAETKFDAAKKSLEAAQANLAKDDASYTPLGPTYPTTSSGRRLALARWIAHPDNPRTARIAVNHLWLRHFGEGLVPTVANFGLNGRKPSHPELLDWLASELTAHDWSLKQLQRTMVTSATYRLASTEGLTEHSNFTRDRDNRFLWRMNSRRAEAEVVRDSTLFVVGELDSSPGGPEIPEQQGLDSRRRSLYFRSTPNEKMTFLELFDQANPNECYRRLESVVPQQALALFNSQLSLNAARRLAAHLTRDELSSTPSPLEAEAKFIATAYETILSRQPTPEELAACQRFLKRLTDPKTTVSAASFPAANPNALAPATDATQRARENLIHVLLNHNDFVTIR